MSKKFLLVVVALLAGVLAFGTGQQPSSATSTAPQVIRVLGFWEFNPNATRDTLVPKWISEATGTIIEPVHVPRDDFDTKFNTMLAAQDFPEMFRLLGTSNAALPEQYGPQGMFVSIDQALTAGKLPNLKRVLASASNAVLDFAPDGHSYRLPSINVEYREPPYCGFNLQEGLLKQAGYDTSNRRLFTTTDQVIDAIIKMKPFWDAKWGQPTPATPNRGVRGIRNNGQLPRVFLIHEYSTDSGIRFAENNRYEYAPLNPRFKAALTALNRLYTAGVLHPDWLTMSEEDQSRLAWVEGKMYFTWFNWISREPKYWERLVASDANSPFKGIVSYDVVGLSVLGQQLQERPAWNSSSGLIINAKPKGGQAAVDAALKVADFLYSDEGATITRYGKEGYAWVKDSTPNNPSHMRWTKCWSGSYPADDCAADSDKSESRGQMIGESPLVLLNQPSTSWGIDWSDHYMDPLDPTGTKAQRYAQLNVIKNWVSTYNLTLAMPEPRFPFLAPELDERAQLEGQLNTYVDEQLVRFVHGQADLRNQAQWDAFIRRVNELGAKRLEELYNTALLRYARTAGLSL